MTDQERKAIEMALEALENADFIVDMADAHYGIEPEDRLQLIEALRTALAQPEKLHGPSWQIGFSDGKQAGIKAALAQPEKEPMSFQTWRSRQHGDPEEIGFLQALKHAYESGQYSVSPPRKEWVGLTDEDSLDEEFGNLDFRRGALWAEAKLREKNDPR